MSAAGTPPPRTLKQTERVRPGGPGGGPLSGGMVAQKAMRFGPSAKRMLARMRPERAKVAAVVALAVVSVALFAVGPRILGGATDLIFAGLFGRQLPPGVTRAQAVDTVRASGDARLADMLAAMDDIVPGQGVDFEAVGRVLLLVLALYVAGSLLSWLQGYLVNDVVQGTVYRMRAEVEDKINRLPLGYFDRQPRGELLSRVTNDIDNVSQSLAQTLSQLLSSLLTVIGVVGMMLYLSPTLALIALVTIPVSMALAGLVMKRSQALFVSQWRRTGTLNAQVEEAFTGHELTKVFGRRRDVEARFAAENEALFEASFGAQFISGLIMPMMMFIGNLNYVAIAVVGGLQVATGAMSLGAVQAFIQYSRQFTHPLTQVASMVNLLQSGVASAERVFELLDAGEEPADSAAPAPPCARRGRVEFEGVSFRYDRDTPLITDLSLLADPGHTVAIVGPTGAGKTTLVNLVMRFYDIGAGRITLDGVDIAQMPRADLRRQVGMVLQDTWLFEGTIRDNIAYGRPGASDAEILEAARATFVHRFVRSLPDGYDTVVDEAGGNLSAGERQLITIARAFLADPALLILDEATSSVDTRTELLLQHAMAALRTDRTSFVIAHRLSTIRDADLILVMDAGRIVERGTHEELLRAGGAYVALYDAQFAAPAVA